MYCVIRYLHIYIMYKKTHIFDNRAGIFFVINLKCLFTRFDVNHKIHLGIVGVSDNNGFACWVSRGHPWPCDHFLPLPRWKRLRCGRQIRLGLRRCADIGVQSYGNVEICLNLFLFFQTLFDQTKLFCKLRNVQLT